MSDEKYIVISPGEDGATIEQLSKSVLLERIDEKYYGDIDFKTSLSPNIEDIDPNYWGDEILIIKGEIVVPQPVKTVTAFEME